MTTPAQPGDHDPQLSPHIQALEAQLAALRPREDRLDRERLMFLAGQASVVQSHRPAFARRRRAWTVSIGATVAAALLLSLVLRPRPNASDRATRSSAYRAVGSVQLGASLSPSDERILRVGMPPARVDQVTAATWEMTDNASDLDSEVQASVLSIRSLNDLL